MVDGDEMRCRKGEGLTEGEEKGGLRGEMGRALEVKWCSGGERLRGRALRY